MSRFAALDLAQVAPPDIIDPLNYELILSELIADFKGRFPEYNVEKFESDPVVKVLEVAAMRELDLRAKVNDAARAVMLPTSGKNDLDNLAALYKTKRLIIGTDPETDLPVYENDVDFKRRISLAPEAFSSCGPRGAYIYFALTGDGENRIATDADAQHTEGGHVTVSIMGENGVPTSDEVSKTRLSLEQEHRLPMTDYITVSAATKKSFNVTGTLVVPAGPDGGMMLQQAINGITSYSNKQRYLGGQITKSGLISAGFVDGSIALQLSEPVENIEPVFGQFPELENINIEVEVR